VQVATCQGAGAVPPASTQLSLYGGNKMDEELTKLYNTFKAQITDEEQEIDNEISDTPKNEEARAHFKTNAQRRIVNRYADLLEIIKKEYAHVYKKKKSHYPENGFVWMQRDKRIKANLETFRIIDILNFLYKYNRRLRGQAYKDMVALADGKKHNGKHDYSSFVVDAKFYDKATKAIGLEKITLQKYFQHFCHGGILIQGKKIDTGGMIYSDGYFTEDLAGKKQKRVFVKQEDPMIIRALREFDYNRMIY
jgi:hypothetical protein